MKKVFLVIPLLSLFVFGCNDNYNSNTKESDEVDGYVVYPTIPDGWYYGKDLNELWKLKNNIASFINVNGGKKAFLTVYNNTGNIYLRLIELKCKITEKDIQDNIIYLKGYCHPLASLTIDSMTTESDQISLLCSFCLEFNISKSKLSLYSLKAESLDSGYENNIDEATLNKILQADDILVNAYDMLPEEYE